MILGLITRGSSEVSADPTCCGTFAGVLPSDRSHVSQSGCVGHEEACETMVRGQGRGRCSSARHAKLSKWDFMLPSSSNLLSGHIMRAATACSIGVRERSRRQVMKMKPSPSADNRRVYVLNPGCCQKEGRREGIREEIGLPRPVVLDLA